MHGSFKYTDLPKLLFASLALLILIVANFWIISPFILGIAWAGMVVIATWPLMLRVQSLCFKKRSLAVTIMSLSLLLLFVLPIATIVNSMVENSGPLLAWISDPKNWKLPDLVWLKKLPVFGNDIYMSWHRILAEDTTNLLAKIQPFAGKTSAWLLSKVTNVGFFVLHCLLMWFFSIIFYSKGEFIAAGIKTFAFRLAQKRGENAVVLAAMAIRAVALGVVVTALLQAILGGLGLAITGIPYAALLAIVIFIFCVAQLGPLFVLIPAVIFLYWAGSPVWGTLLLIWSLIISTLDSVLRPLLIKKGANLPILLILIGVIGGLIEFGMIGLFIGPVVLAVSYRLLIAWIHEDQLENKT